MSPGTYDMTTHHTQGRGSNPVSRKNLTGPMRDAYVFSKDGNGTWGALAGPMTLRQAEEWVLRLKAAAGPLGEDMYAASRGLGDYQPPIKRFPKS